MSNFGVQTRTLGCRLPAQLEVDTFCRSDGIPLKAFDRGDQNRHQCLLFVNVKGPEKTDPKSYYEGNDCLYCNR
jgi:hypothetical protein